MLSVILPFQMPRTLSLPQYHMLCANVSMTPRWQTSHTRYINSLHRRTLLVKRVLVTHLDMHLNTLGISSMYMGERGLGSHLIEVLVCEQKPTTCAITSVSNIGKFRLLEPCIGRSFLKTYCLGTRLSFYYPVLFTVKKHKS